MSIKNLHKMSLSQIKAEITWRRKTFDQMVGTLYPTIVWGELEELRERQREIEQILKNEGYEI